MMYKISRIKSDLRETVYLIFIILIIECKLIASQFIPTTHDLQVNGPLQRWEQFQKQLKLNQLTVNPASMNGYQASFPSSNNFATSNFGSPLSNLNSNNLDNLFTINPAANPDSNTIDLIQNNNNKPTVVLSSLPNGVAEAPNSIFISDNRDANHNRYLSTSNSPHLENGDQAANSPNSNSPNKYIHTLDQDLRFTTNSAFLDSIKNRTGDPSSPPLNSSYSNSVQTRTHADNFKELNHNLTRNHYIELSKKFMNLTLSITDSQFRGFLKFVHELSGKINSDCKC